MKFNRRSFLKTAGGIALAVAAPIYIPAERLEFGVPTVLATARTVLRPATSGTTMVIGDHAEYIQGLIDRTAESGGGVVRLRPGVYTLSRTVEMRSDVLLDGIGTRFHAAPELHDAIVNFGPDVTGAWLTNAWFDEVGSGQVAARSGQTLFGVG